MPRDYNDDRTEMHKVLLCCNVEAHSVKDAADTVKDAVDLRTAAHHEQTIGDVYVQRVERPDTRLERVEVLRVDDD